MITPRRKVIKSSHGDVVVYIGGKCLLIGDTKSTKNIYHINIEILDREVMQYYLTDPFSFTDILDHWDKLTSESIDEIIDFCIDKNIKNEFEIACIV